MATHMAEHRGECRQLLLALKTTVEGLLVNQTTNVWNTYGGLSRLSNVVHDVLNHGLKRTQGKTEYWNFIVGLRVLVPTLAPWLERHHLATEGNPSRGFLWIQHRLQEHSLSTYLKILLNDHVHVASYYQETAFLQQWDYSQALLTCLESVESNRLATLAELNPILLVDSRRKGHTRSPSLPTNISGCPQKQFSTDPSAAAAHSRGGSKDDVWRHPGNAVRLRRQTPLDRSKGDAYRSAICYDATARHDAQMYLKQQQQQKQQRGLSKSITWNDHLLTGTAAGPRGSFRGHSKRPWSSLNELEVSACSDEALVSRATKSLPALDTRGQDTDDDDRHEKVAKYNLSADCDGERSTEPSNVAAPATPASGMARSRSVEEEPSDLRVAVVQQQRSPSHHVRSRSEVSVASLASIEADIPLSSSLPTCLCSDEDAAVDGGLVMRSKVEVSTPIFRRPVEGQSLTSFLSSQDFRTCAELDKENAHFSISEALISAIEQIKCNQMLKIAEEDALESDDDDEEIKQLRQRIRIRRRERLQEKTLFKSPQLLSDGRTDTPTTTTSPSPQSTSSDKSDGNTSADSLDPIDVSDGSEVDSKLSTIHESGLSLSMASLYSDADIHKPSSTLTSNSNSYEISSAVNDSVSCFSAESVALCLIRKFSEKQLPKASDLEWLVSEQDAPQKLLPLPSSWPVSPDDAENVQQLQTRLRGNLEWAPPRPQIIFSIHPSPQRRIVIAKQNYRCAGCGTKVEQGFMKRFRYCEYLGKYFCQCCHNNTLAHIPGRVLRKWDFSRYCVSNFSRDLLEKMFGEPLCDINEMNASLYRRVRALSQVLQCRLQLYYVKDFVRACRKCQSLVEELYQLPAHLLSNPHLYSLRDLLQVKSGDLLAKLKPLVKLSLSHVAQCPLCQARGFFCEMCKNSEEVIFPFQIDRVVQCQACRSCFHSDCYVADKCPKCARIEMRRQRLLQEDDME